MHEVVYFYYNLIGWILVLLVLITIYGGARYFLSMGNEKKKAKAVKIFVYGLLALFIAALVYASSLVMVDYKFPMK